MMNSFILRCARNTPVYWRTFSLHLLCAKSLLKQQAKSFLCAKYTQQTLVRGLNTKQNKTLSYSAVFIEFEQRLQDEDDFEMTFHEWETLTKKIIENDPRIENTLDSKLMRRLDNKPDLSLSLFRYIKSKREPNMSTLIRFFQNCVKKYEDIVLEEVNNFKETYGSNKIFQEEVASVIALTKEWRQVISFVHDVSYFNLQMYISLLENSLKHQDYLTFFEIWTKAMQHGKSKFENITQSLFELWENCVIPTDLFFELLKLEDLPLADHEVQKLQNYCKSEWKYCKSAVLVNVDGERRRCKSCNKALPKIEPIDESVITRMFEETMKNALIGNNIFVKTTPKELEKFSKFMEKEGPFDYIIDGLNVVNLLNKPHLKKELQWENSYMGKRVLVITKYVDKTLKKFKGPIFKTDRQSYDDIYIMLAALMSGPNCYIVTNDNFGDHISIVSKELRPFFEAWRTQQRVFFISPNKFQHSPTYKFRASETENGWHIPWRESDERKLISKNSDITKMSKALLEMRSRRFLCLEKTSDYLPSSQLQLFRQVTEEWKKIKEK